MAGVITRAPLRLGKLIPQNTCLFLCDLQEKFRNSIQYFPQIVEISGRLLKAFSLLELPVVATEQYPKGGLTLILESYYVMTGSRTLSNASLSVNEGGGQTLW